MVITESQPIVEFCLNYLVITLGCVISNMFVRHDIFHRDHLYLPSEATNDLYSDVLIITFS